jgi:ADP-heptose:LPS heptosyltransferase
MGVPTVCLFGGVSNPAVWQPSGPRVSVVHVPVPCAYCHKNVPADCIGDNRCMKEIAVGAVVQEVRRLLQGKQ